jgi:mitogen-activated protein kinase organizer 1
LQTIKGGINVQYRCRSMLSADDSTIIAGDEQGKIQAWDVLSGKQRPFASQTSDAHTKAVLSVDATTKDGGRVVSAAADGTVKIWGRRLME